MAVTKRGFLTAILAAAALTFISLNTNSPHTPYIYGHLFSKPPLSGRLTGKRSLHTGKVTGSILVLPARFLFTFIRLNPFPFHCVSYVLGQTQNLGSRSCLTFAA